ncbi:MAG: ribbon-helix-helix domain-containing protein [Candidatus Desantisbacteria bacterium]
MPRKGYTTIALPNILLDQVDEIVQDKRYGYISKPELIKEAIRENIRTVKKLSE